MTNEQIQRIYNTKMRNIMLKNKRREQEQDDADRLAFQKKQAANDRTSLKLSLAGMYKDLKESHEMSLMQQTYDDNIMGTRPPKFERKDPRSFGEVITQPIESAKRLLPGKLGAYQETEGYKQFKAKKEASEISLKESREQAGDIVPVAEEFAADEPIAYERLGQTEDVWTPPTVPAPLDMAALDESAKRGLYDRWYQSQAEGLHPDMIDKLPNYETWKEGVEEGTISSTYIEKVPMLIPPVQPDVPLAVEDEFYTPTEEVIEVDDLPAPAPQPDYTKIQTASDLAQEQQLGKTKRITEFDPMGDVDLGVSPELEGAPDIMMESPQLKGAEGAPITDVEIPDAKPGGKFIGKTLNALQTGQQMLNIGKTLTNEEASGADKALAGTQGVKMLADLAAKRAGQETISQIGSGAVSELTSTIAEEGFKKGVKGLGKESLKLTGKQAAGAALGGVIGGYTAVTEAKEAGEAWEEKDYDEAILHGMGSASGMFQTAGAGMMLSGVGTPIGAVLYGIGTAGSVISSAGLMLENLFGGGGEPDKPEKPKFNAGKYFDSIRRSSYGR